MFEKVFEYWPTMTEIFISIGIWAMGFFIISVLFKIATTIKEEVAA
jgi:Ni/Fe-hydrogenase subunit HybB-like protein